MFAWQPLCHITLSEHLLCLDQFSRVLYQKVAEISLNPELELPILPLSVPKVCGGYSMYCILCILFSTLNLMHCIQCIVFYELYYMYWIICMVLYLQYYIHYFLCIVFYASNFLKKWAPRPPSLMKCFFNIFKIRNKISFIDKISRSFQFSCMRLHIFDTKQTLFITLVRLKTKLVKPKTFIINFFNMADGLHGRWP